MYTREKEYIRHLIIVHVSHIYGYSLNTHQPPPPIPLFFFFFSSPSLTSQPLALGSGVVPTYAVHAALQ